MYVHELCKPVSRNRQSLICCFPLDAVILSPSALLICKYDKNSEVWDIVVHKLMTVTTVMNYCIFVNVAITLNMIQLFQIFRFEDYDTVQLAVSARLCLFSRFFLHSGCWQHLWNWEKSMVQVIEASSSSTGFFLPWILL